MLNLPDQLEWLVNHEVVMLFIHFHHTWKSCHSIKGVPTPLQLKVLITAPIAVETDAWNIVNPYVCIKSSCAVAEAHAWYVSNVHGLNRCILKCQSLLQNGGRIRRRNGLSKIWC